MKIKNDWIAKYGLKNYQLLYDCNDVFVVEVCLKHREKSIIDPDQKWNTELFKSNLRDRYDSKVRDFANRYSDIKTKPTFDEIVDELNAYKVKQFFKENASLRAYSSGKLGSISIYDILHSLFPYFPEYGKIDEENAFHEMYVSALGSTYHYSSTIMNIYYDELKDDNSHLLSMDFDEPSSTIRFKFITQFQRLHHLFMALKYMYNISIEVSSATFCFNVVGFDFSSNTNRVYLYKLDERMDRAYDHSYYVSFVDGLVMPISNEDGYFPAYMFSSLQDEFNIGKINFAENVFSDCSKRIDGLVANKDKANKFIDDYKNISLQEYVECE